MDSTTVLLQIRSVTKAYDQAFSALRMETGLGQREIDILAFLKNNPQKDTARDIVELRMLPKANVSLGVEVLIKQGLLTRRSDSADRRRIHLALTKPGHTLAQRIVTVQGEYWSALLTDFTPQEKEAILTFGHRISANAMRWMEDH